MAEPASAPRRAVAMSRPLDVMDMPSVARQAAECPCPCHVRPSHAIGPKSFSCIQATLLDISHAVRRLGLACAAVPRAGHASWRARDNRRRPDVFCLEPEHPDRALETHPVRWANPRHPPSQARRDRLPTFMLTFVKALCPLGFIEVLPRKNRFVSRTKKSSPDCTS